MEIKVGDYVKYKGKVYSVAHSYIDERDSFELISYKDLKILVGIHKSELERLTDFHVSVMRYNKDLPPRRFREGDLVEFRADLDSECVYGQTFRDMYFDEDSEYEIDEIGDTDEPCCLCINDCNIHEFEVELV